MLRSDPELAGEIGAAAEGFFSGDARDVGIVIVFGEMREDQETSAGVKAFGVGEKFADGVIGKMAGATHHALLDVPRIGTNLEHFEIVIRFENQTIGIAQMVFHEFGQIAEIGGHGDFRSIGTESEAQRIGGIVRNREWRDFDIADDEFLPGANVFDAREALGRAIGQDAFDFVVRGFGEINGRAPENRGLHEAADVVGMLVRENDAVECVRAAAEGIEAAKKFFFAEAGIHEKSGVLGLKQRAIA